MRERFHASEFDHATRVKLEIFRGYVREWLPVFLARRRTGDNPSNVNLFDFFAGPGTDARNNPGSPLLIQRELKKFCANNRSLRAEGTNICLYFNDKDEEKIDQLKRHLGDHGCDEGCCRIVYSARPFQESLQQSLGIMRGRGSANLVIMDQFGVSEVSPTVVSALAECSRTDILFFIPSSIVHRFCYDPAICKYLEAAPEQLRASDHKLIHKHVCDYYRSKLTVNTEYHLAPFSLRKSGGNIYGVIFGSAKLLGLEKFLKVCWHLDPVTGEANYPIEDRVLWEASSTGQLPLRFSNEDGFPTKMQVFHQELEEALSRNKDCVEPRGGELLTNRDIYRFTLEHGFLPKHANDHLSALQKDKRLRVIDQASGSPARERAFYLTWNEYNRGLSKVEFSLSD